MTTIKHGMYTLATLFVLSFGMLLLNQAQELNSAAEVLACAIISFGGYLCYELVTTDDYRLTPMLCFGGAVIAMIGTMCLYAS